MAQERRSSGRTHVWNNDFFAKPGALCWLLAFSVAASGIIQQLLSLAGQLLLIIAGQYSEVAASLTTAWDGITGSFVSIAAYIFPTLCEAALCVLTYAYADPLCGRRFLRYTLTGVIGVVLSGVWCFYGWQTVARSGVFLITVGAFLLLLFSNTRLSDRIIWYTVTGLLLLFAILRVASATPTTVGAWYTMVSILSGYGKQLLYWILLGLFRRRFNILHP